MIRFNCHCTHEFLVAEDQAGGMVQCPKCGRLNDVPLLSDAQNLEDGGIFKMDASPIGPGKNVIPNATRAYTRSLQDDDGNDIDMRNNVDAFLAAGSEEVPLELADQVRPGVPKYDPLTGELVVPLDVKPTAGPDAVDAKNIPVAKRAINYAAVDVHSRVTPGTIFIALFQPVNLFVMTCVVFAHLLFQATLSVVMAGIFFAAPVLIIIGAILIAHYGSVVDEIATAQADELPRPLRDFSFGEDIWTPFVRFNFSLLLCFWPWIFQHNLDGPMQSGFLVAATLFGIYFFPAVLLTTITGGSYLNLRPDRVIGVIRACGPSYLISVLAFFVGGSVYLAGIFGVSLSMMKFFERGSVAAPLFTGAIASPLLLGGIYLFHFACWHLGLLYRANYPRFPWVLQRHTQSRRTDTLAQLEAARIAAKHHDMLRARRPDREQRLAEIRATEKNAAKAADAAKPIWDRVSDTNMD